MIRGRSRDWGVIHVEYSNFTVFPFYRLWRHRWSPNFPNVRNIIAWISNSELPYALTVHLIALCCDPAQWGCWSEFHPFAISLVIPCKFKALQAYLRETITYRATIIMYWVSVLYLKKSKLLECKQLKPVQFRHWMPREMISRVLT